MFCYSHLIGRFLISNVKPSPPAPVFQITPKADNPIFNIISQSDVAKAMKLVETRNPTRTFVFGRSNGHW